MIFTSIEQLLEFKSEEPLNLYTGDRGFFPLQRYLHPEISTFPKECSGQKLTINNMTVQWLKEIDDIAKENPKMPAPNGGFIEQYWYTDLKTFSKRMGLITQMEILSKNSTFDIEDLRNFFIQKYILFKEDSV